MLVLGMMSGTSADGIDVAMVRIAGAPPALNIQLVNHASVAFPSPVRKEILRVAEQNQITSGELSQLHFRLGHVYAEAALTACKKFRISPRRIDLIGNHGQTIFHQGKAVPFLGKPTVSTLQIGENSIIAAKTGITTASDFRPADMALGGQGAPLVPFVDYALYRHPKLGRVSLNIGGIANVTVIPAGAPPDQVFAFDTGPGNMLIDALVRHFSKGRQQFDRGGRLADHGRDQPKLLDKLMNDPYIRQPPPKSTGREYYGRAYVEKILRWGRECNARPNDVIRAATAFTLTSVVVAMKLFVLPKVRVSEMVVSGGGAKNTLMMQILAAMLKGESITLVGSSGFGIPEDAKEALAFALLAYETFHQRPSNIPTATGARGRAILGKISYAPPR